MHDITEKLVQITHPVYLKKNFLDKASRIKNGDFVKGPDPR